jgi:hypothetical protein
LELVRKHLGSVLFKQKDIQMPSRLFASWITLIVTLLGTGAVVGAFDPRAYSRNKQTANCKAVRRLPPPAKDVDIKIRELPCPLLLLYL